MSERETALKAGAEYATKRARRVRVLVDAKTGGVLRDHRGRVAVRNVDTDRLSYVQDGDLCEVAGEDPVPVCQWREWDSYGYGRPACRVSNSGVNWHRSLAEQMQHCPACGKPLGLAASSQEPPVALVPAEGEK